MKTNEDLTVLMLLNYDFDYGGQAVSKTQAWRRVVYMLSKCRIGDSPVLPIWVTLARPWPCICPKCMATIFHQYPMGYTQGG